MATSFFALTLTGTVILPFSSSSSRSLSPLSSSTASLFCSKFNAKRPSSHTALVCKAAHDLNRRSFAVCLTTITLSLTGKALLPGIDANAAILEADDDEELLERVKRDRKKRLQRQEVISSSKKETGYLQELVYKLSKVGQAIENNDLSAASSVLGPNTNSDWVQNVNMAFTKLSSSPEEKLEADTFNSSLVSLISSVTKNDVETSKKAFVSSASAFEKWTTLTGLVGQLKGL